MAQSGSWQDLLEPRLFTMENDEINACFDQARQGADVVLVEGTKGLHDGVDVNGKDSNAALAH